MERRLEETYLFDGGLLERSGKELFVKHLGWNETTTSLTIVPWLMSMRNLDKGWNGWERSSRIEYAELSETKRGRLRKYTNSRDSHSLFGAPANLTFKGQKWVPIIKQRWTRPGTRRDPTSRASNQLFYIVKFSTPRNKSEPPSNYPEFTQRRTFSYSNKQ